MRDRPWHRNVVALHVKDWIVGRDRHECANGDPVEAIIPMPEGCYRAIFTPEVRTWRNRFRTIRREGYSIEIPGGIPFQGKGENSWDCGDDGLFGTGTSGSIEDGIGHVVATVLAYRKRHGTTREVRAAGVVMARDRMEPSS